MKKSEFEQLIEKYELGLLSGREKELMDAWFESLGQDEVRPLRTEAEREGLKQRVMAGLAGHEARGSRVETAKAVLPMRLWKVAASIILVAAASYAVWQYTSRITFIEPQVLTALSAEGAVHKVLLDDGSLVWLKNNSVLTYPSKFTGPQRRVVLSGEALFEVAKDARHPFVIQCGELTTTVLGTSFNIRSTEKDIEVVVLTGKVSLTSRDNPSRMVVLPTEKAVYRREMNELAKVEALPQEAVSSISGTEYDMSFRETRMQEVIRRMELKFDVSISVSDATIKQCMITADLTDQSLKKTLDVIAATLHFSYVLDGRSITITGAGCSE
jgi:transmembrane sensor